jgi:CheY-like chemotaxis protein
MDDGRQKVIPRILIVEDDAEMADLMKDMLAPVHCQILIARSGKGALTLLRQQATAGRKIDLVLLDIMMP